MCSSCAWAKPPEPHVAEFCENGAKATIWELTTRPLHAGFFRRHTVTELRDWSDYDLEKQGRLTASAALRSPRTIAMSVRLGRGLRRDRRGTAARSIPKSVIFYASGQARAGGVLSLRAVRARLWQQQSARQLEHVPRDDLGRAEEGHRLAGRHLHRSKISTIATRSSIFGQNPGTNSPRFLHPLQDAVERGCKIVMFNPVQREGPDRVRQSAEPVADAVGKPTPICAPISAGAPRRRHRGADRACASMCWQPTTTRRRGGRRRARPRFHRRSTRTGFEAFRGKAATRPTGRRSRRSPALTRADLEARGATSMSAPKSVIGVYGMGLTQHVHGSQSIGDARQSAAAARQYRPAGRGLPPVRGHSNVQGQRTVGISEKPELVPLDKHRGAVRLRAAAREGPDHRRCLRGHLSGEVKALLGLGGNLVAPFPIGRDGAGLARAGAHRPYRDQAQPQPSDPRQGPYLLPCLARAEEDMQASGPQTGDDRGQFQPHLWLARAARARERPLKSELAIVAGIAKATLPPQPAMALGRLDRRLRAGARPDRRDLSREFHDLTRGCTSRAASIAAIRRMSGSGKPKAARPNSPSRPCSSPAASMPQAGRSTLITLRSNDQFNTTIYGSMTGCAGSRARATILLINPHDMARAGPGGGRDGHAGDRQRRRLHREVPGLTVTPFDLPDGCLAGIFPS